MNKQNAWFCLWTPKGMKITQVHKRRSLAIRDGIKAEEVLQELCVLQEIVDSRLRHLPIREPLYINKKLHTQLDNKVHLTMGMDT